MGLLIFNAVLSIKYGISPCIRLTLVNVSEALSAATRWWNTVDARLGGSTATVKESGAEECTERD